MSDRKTLVVTAQVPVWLYPHCRIDTLLDQARKGDDITGMLSFWNKNPSYGEATYTRVGDAEITIHLTSEDEMVQARIQALNAEIEAARAAFLQKQQQILEQISKLQALEAPKE